MNNEYSYNDGIADYLKIVFTGMDQFLEKCKNALLECEIIEELGFNRGISISELSKIIDNTNDCLNSIDIGNHYYEENQTASDKEVAYQLSSIRNDEVASAKTNKIYY